MKILIVNKFLHPNGGSETYIFKLGEELTREGHEVQYFGMEHQDRVVSNELDLYTDNMDFHGGGLGKLLLPFKIIYSREAYVKILKVLKNFEPDVVHINNFNFQLTPSIIYACRKWEKDSGHKLKVVYTAHDYQWVCPNHMMVNPSTGNPCESCLKGDYSECVKCRCIHGSRLRSILGAFEAKLYRRLGTYQKVDTIICPSEFLKDKLSAYEGLEPKLVTLHNFLETEKVDVLKEDYVLYFGRYSKEKGIDTLLKVCDRLKDIEFIFAGKGPLEEEVNKRNNIQNRGFLSGTDLYETIATARFVVFPSEWYENCPFTVMESQMYHTPVIASNMGGVPELMEDGVTGELFEAGNVDELTAKISDLWNNREKLDVYTKNTEKVRFDDLRDYTEKYLHLIQNENINAG